VRSLTRVGKYLLLEFETNNALLLHLGMTGQLIVAGAKSPRLVFKRERLAPDEQILSSFEPDRHTHLSIHFDDGGPALHFRDARKFGKVCLLPAGSRNPRLEKLGPDALKVTGEILFDAARKRRLKVKSLLLDQGVLAGIGNIYADEALHFARIHPERAANRLSLEECTLLAKVIRKLLTRSIANGGSSIDDYVHPDGSDGQFQRQFRVYGRTGDPCRTCSSKVERLVIGQRSSHFCPHCQR
jgi:formamidopyrimidine-DNA glycosylase